MSRSMLSKAFFSYWMVTRCSQYSHAEAAKIAKISKSLVADHHSSRPLVQNRAHQ